MGIIHTLTKHYGLIVHFLIIYCGLQSFILGDLILIEGQLLLIS
jgi:hypothetical protein